jgi:hypothetical protein
MTKSIKLKHITDFKKVCYYSVCIEYDDGEIDETSLFEGFVYEFENCESKKLQHIQNWLEQIGNKYGASIGWFRPEQCDGEALGLPPSSKKHPQYIEDGHQTSNNLRLYCHRANDQVVFLFSGGIKTADTPQNCPNVKDSFELANKLTEVIDQAMISKEITWNEDYSDIIYPESLTLTLEL